MKTPELSFYERIREATSVAPSAPLDGNPVEKEMEQSNSDFKTPVTLRNLFTHHDAHPVVLDLALMKAFKTEWLYWEIETLWAEIQRAFKTQISEHARAKINALRACHFSSAPWESWHVFEKVIQALNNNLPSWELVQAPSLEHLYGGLDILKHIRNEEFSEEVKLYMAAAVLNEEVTFTPAPLDFLQVYVSRPSYKCLDCGNEDLALFHDGICDTCSKKFDEENTFSMRPTQEVAEQKIGRNLDVVLLHDPTDVEARWEKVVSSPTASIELDPDSAVDVQVVKLLLARDYMNIRRRQLNEQIVALKSWLGASE